MFVNRCWQLHRSWVGTRAALIAFLLSIGASSYAPSPTYAAEPTPQSAGTADADCPDWTTTNPLPSWAGQMPEPRATAVSSFSTEVSSANGDRIFARVWLPAEPYDRRLPTALELWPFSNTTAHLGTLPHAPGPGWDARAAIDVNALCGVESAAVFLLRRGYAVVIADNPGTGNSTGCFDLGGPAEQQAGKALVDWIVGQPWSDGAVGMRGHSAAGLSQLATAAARPEALRAIIPTSPTPTYGIFHPGAATTELRAFIALFFGFQAAPATDPTASGYADTLIEAACPEDYLKWNDAEGTLDAYWRQRHLPLLAARGKAAVLTTAGDAIQDPSIGWYPMWHALEQNGLPRKAFVGIWEHNHRIDNWPLHELRWFEHWLRGNDTAVTAEPLLTLFDQDNSERVAMSFPARTVSFHASAGRLGGPPEGGTATYTDIPGAPQDVLREGDGSLDYISEPLTAPVRLSGAGQLLLWASIDSTDTDFAALVYDVAPDGSRRLMTWGYFDARHRRALDQPGVPVVPGAVERYRLPLAGTQWTLHLGHRLALYLASSDGCTPPFPEPGFVPPCSEVGILRSDGSRAKVTVHEGPGLTRLQLPSLP